MPINIRNLSTAYAWFVPFSDRSVKHFDRFHILDGLTPFPSWQVMEVYTTERENNRFRRKVNWHKELSLCAVIQTAGKFPMKVNWHKELSLCAVWGGRCRIFRVCLLLVSSISNISFLFFAFYFGLTLSDNWA